MVTIAFHSSSPSRSRIVAPRRPSVAHRLASISKALVAEWRIRQAVKSLEAMDRHLLLDMGVMRGGIEDAVRHGR